MSSVLVIAGGAVFLLAALGVLALVGARTLAAAVGRAARAEREATVRAAVDTVLSVAADKLGDHVAAGTRELDLRSHAIDRQFSDMAGQLRHVTDLVASLQRERAEQHGQLVQGLSEAARSTAALADSTQGLRQALASPKARGQWGERMADDVLRLAGFVEGINYRKQTALPGGTMPDFTFLLPRGLLLHMDVKFPIDNYLRHLDAPSDADRTRTCTAFLRDVRQRIKELAGRGYIDPDTTVDYLLLFIPNESVYGFIHEHDPTIADLALQQKVVLCSPFTLFAVLAVIRQAVDNFLLERTSDEILQALAGFADQWRRFSDQVDTVGKRIESAHNAFDDLSGTRRRQLQRTLDEIEAIRARRDDAAPPVSATPPLREVSAW